MAVRKRAERPPWKTARDVERLTVSKRELGAGVHGDVFVGWLKFKGAPARRVAVKVFRAGLNRSAAAEYLKAIKDLTRAGVPLPKMGIFRHNDRWVLVLEAFMKGGKTKLIKDHPTAADTVHRAKILARVINAGYFPKEDIFEVIEGSRKSVPIDLQGVISAKWREIEKKIASAVNAISRWETDFKEKAAIRCFVAELLPEHRALAKEIIKFKTDLQL